MSIDLNGLCKSPLEPESKSKGVGSLIEASSIIEHSLD